MNSRITLALESTPSSMKALLSDIVLADNFDATLSPEQFSSLRQASGLADDELRIALLPFAATYSYAPLSDFTLARSCVVCLVLCTLVQTLKSRVRNLAKPYTQSNLQSATLG